MDLVPRYRFERFVQDALDDLPDELLHVLENVVVQVHDRNPDEPDLLGLYHGVPHTERTGHEGPDVVSIYRAALCDMCETIDELADELQDASDALRDEHEAVLDTIEERAVGLEKSDIQVRDVGILWLPVTSAF